MDDLPSKPDGVGGRRAAHPRAPQAPFDFDFAALQNFAGAKDWLGSYGKFGRRRCEREDQSSDPL